MASQQNKRAKGLLLGAIGDVKLLAFDAIEKMSGTRKVRKKKKTLT
jgi:hypothetical protein